MLLQTGSARADSIDFEIPCCRAAQGGAGDSEPIQYRILLGEGYARGKGGKGGKEACLGVSGGTKRGVEGFGAQHKFAGVPARIILLVHNAQQCEEVAPVRSACAWRHVCRHHQSCQRRRVQPDECALMRLAICACRKNY